MAQPMDRDTEARRELRRHHEGSLVFDGFASAVRFVVCGRSGRIVLPVEPVVLTASEHVLFVPEERDGALQLLLCVEACDPAGKAGEACDRWRVFHGETSMRTWAVAEVVSGKCRDEVFEPDSLCPINPLHDCEFRLLKVANSDREALARACRGRARVDVVNPQAVGVDELGIDVRARFGIVRLEFPDAVPDEAAAAMEIDRLMRSAP